MTADDDAAEGSDSPEIPRRPQPGPGPQPAAPEPAGAPPAPTPVRRTEPAEPPFPLPIRTIEPPRHTRRWFLAGAGAVLLGAGGGVAAEFARKVPKPAPNPPPRALVAALQAEHALLASVGAARNAGSDGDLLDQLERDHRAHLQAVHAALAQFDPLRPSPGSTRGSSASAAPSTTLAALHKAEAAAAQAGATRAGQLRGRNATLLASISACEATHAELLA